MLAIIGGSGVYNPELLEDLTTAQISTPYGSVEYVQGNLEGQAVVFLTRHGGGHTVPPHLVNYRANIWALKKLGVTKIIATAAVGSLDPHIATGDFVLVDDFLDFTKSRPTTFFDGQEGKVLHVDMNHPYCPCLREDILTAAQTLQLPMVKTGIYVCAEGPRYESKAEIKVFQHLGGTVVGMTNVPECVLAKEAEMCYATICLITNYAAGITKNNLTFKEVVDIMEVKKLELQNLLRLSIVAARNSACTCNCFQAATEIGGFKV